MFQFHASRPDELCIHSSLCSLPLHVFPHSDIDGSLRAYRSPSRFAVCCVLLRLSVPRHPPYALLRFTFFSSSLFRCCYLFSRLLLGKTFQILSDPRSLFPSFVFTSLLSSFQCTLFECLPLKTKQLLRTHLPCFLPRKEVIHPHVPVGIPCYDFTPIISPTLDSSLPCGLGHRLRVLPTLMV